MQLKYYLNSARLSKNCIIYSFIQLGLALTIAGYLFFINPDRLIIEILESLLTSLFFLELMVKLLLDQENFIKNQGNRIDLVMFTIIILIMIIYKVLTMNQMTNDEILVYLLILRYILQSIRILVNIRITQENLSFIETTEIKFNPEENQNV